MKTLAAALLLALSLAPSAFTQDEAPAKAKPKTKARRAPKVMQGEPAESSDATRRIFALPDKTIADLAEAVRVTKGCVADGDYLIQDLAATTARVKAKNGGIVPSGQAPLIVLKQARLSQQRAACTARTKALMPLFDNATLTLSRTEPQSHPGIKTRRERIAALREQANEIYRKMGGKAGSSKPSSPVDDAADSDASQ
jgi:hypothetical protein